MRYLLIATLLVLVSGSGCDDELTYQRPVRGPNGGQGWMIHCKERADCYDKATRLCKYGYNPVDSGYVRREFSIFIECRESNGAGRDDAPAASERSD